MRYKHTQIGYFMLIVTLAVIILFVWSYLSASAEPASVDSGTNLGVTAVMTIIVLTLASFGTLQVKIDQTYLHIKFGFGMYKKKFLLSEITSVKTVKNRWYYGRGIRYWRWPKMRIYNVSGLNAVEIITKNGKRYRIGTDEPMKLAQAISQTMK